MTYKNANGVALKMDVYSPAHLPTNAQLPAVLFVHGGPIRADLSLLPKDWGVYKSYGALMANSNLVGVIFNHRLFAVENLLQSADDITAAIQFVRDNALQFNIDPQRLGIWGFSGGGPLLGFALRGDFPFIRCWLAFYTRLDLRNGLPETLAKLSVEAVQRFSTVMALEESSTAYLPMFVARAGQDRPVLNETIDAFVQKALALNKPITAVNHPTGQHAFDILDDDVRTREIIAMALAFIKAHLV